MYSQGYITAAPNVLGVDVFGEFDFLVRSYYELLLG
jgi:hypothetical protein